MGKWGERVIKDCSVCGKEMVLTPFCAAKRKTCSVACSNKTRAIYTDQVARWRAGSHKRRAAVRSDEYERFDAIKVFERDGWRCHLCGKKTLKSKRGTKHDLAPELEHITSLKDGGGHTLRNVACSCRKCNAVKNSDSYGQLNLGYAV